MAHERKRSCCCWLGGLRWCWLGDDGNSPTKVVIFERAKGRANGKKRETRTEKKNTEFPKENYPTGRSVSFPISCDFAKVKEHWGSQILLAFPQTASRLAGGKKWQQLSYSLFLRFSFVKMFHFLCGIFLLAEWIALALRVWAHACVGTVYAPLGFVRSCPNCQQLGVASR